MKDGILVVNKPEGISSAGVVGRLKRLLNVKKIGHTGTLDPFATGVLLIAIGKATRISRFFLDGSKGYRARVTLGSETDTYDCTGQETAKAEPSALEWITEKRVQELVTSFFGPQEQVAPSYSALKHNGQPLYKLARQGKMIQKPPRHIDISHISMEHFEAGPEGEFIFDMDVECSGGTYIRSIAYDMGKRLGCGAHLSGLCRTRSGQFRLEGALDLNDIESMDLTAVEDKVVSMSECLKFLPVIIADKALIQKIGFGQKFGDRDLESPVTKFEPDSFIRVVDDHDTLLAIVQPDESGQAYKYSCVFTG